MSYIENPPSVTAETKWAYEQLIRLLALVEQQQAEIDSLKEKLVNS